MPTPALFAFRFSIAYRLAGLPFGVTPRTAAVSVDGGQFALRFGPWRLRTPLDNVVSTELTGPFALLKTAGPAHLSLRDRGLTCATNGKRGICVRFADPVSGIEPIGVLRHPAVTVTVADLEGLADVLAAVRRS